MSTAHFEGPPIDLRSLRAMVTAQLDMCRQLLPHLSVEGLDRVRRRCKDRDVLDLCALGGPMAELRVNVLESTCRHLVAAGKCSIEVYEALGDILPSAPEFCPDDLS